MIRLILPWFIPKGYNGFSFGPFIIMRRRELLTDLRFLNHETIHFFQHLELLFIGFWALYVWFYVAGRLRGKDHSQAYRSNPFEAEAYANDDHKTYLLQRRPYSWLKYMRR